MSSDDRLNHAFGHAASISSSLIWGTSMVAYRLLADSTTPIGIALTQFALAAPILLALGMPAFRRLERPRVMVPMMLGWGMVAPGLVLVFSATAAEYLDILVINVFWGLLPLLVPLFAFLVLKERVSIWLPIGGTLALTGLVVVVTGRQIALAAPLFGYAAIVIAVSCTTFSMILGRFILRGRPEPMAGAALQVCGALLTTGLIAILFGEAPFVPTTGRDFALTGFLALGLGVGNYVAYNVALKRLRVAWVSLYGGLIPVIGVVATVFLGEAVPFITWVMVTLVVIGVAMPHGARLLRESREGRLAPPDTTPAEVDRRLEENREG